MRKVLLLALLPLLLVLLIGAATAQSPCIGSYGGTLTPNIGLYVHAPGSTVDVNTWGSIQNDNWDCLDAMLGGTKTVPALTVTSLSVVGSCTGCFTISPTFTNVTVTGTLAAQVLNVAGLSSLNGGLAVTGNSVFNNNVAIAGTLAAQVLNAAGLSSLNGGLAVTGNSVFNNNVAIAGTLAAQVLNAAGLSSLNGGLAVTGNSVFNNNVAIAGTLGVINTATIGNGVVTNTLQVPTPTAGNQAANKSYVDSAVNSVVYIAPPAAAVNISPTGTTPNVAIASYTPSSAISPSGSAVYRLTCVFDVQNVADQVYVDFTVDGNPALILGGIEYVTTTQLENRVKYTQYVFIQSDFLHIKNSTEWCTEDIATSLNYQCTPGGTSTAISSPNLGSIASFECRVSLNGANTGGAATPYLFMVERLVP